MTAYVYVCGPHGRRKADDLRYSMRSVARYGGGASEIWISGWAPDCVDRSKVNYIEGPRTPDKHESSTANLLLACQSQDVPAEFVWMHDDFYLLRPSPVPHLHRGLLSERIQQLPTGPYRQLHVETLDYLQERGIEQPLCFELHRPIVVSKELMRAVLKDLGDRRVCKRTIYGNLAHLGGQAAPDVKVHGRDGVWNHEDWCVSSSDNSITGALGSWLRDEFMEPSPWEQPDPPRAHRRRRSIPVST